MWIMMSDCFLSIVRKDCSPGQLLVRARREGDIEKVFGRPIEVERETSTLITFSGLASPRRRLPRSCAAR